jgi:hypothetical protein
VENRWIKVATMLPPTIEVCGTRLLPFCLRHRVALTAINSPALSREREMTGADLVAAVRILSSKTIEEVRKPSTWKEAWWAAKLRRDQKALIAEAAALMVYFEAQSLWPRFWEKPAKPSQATGTPWELVVVASLIRNGCTTEEAWTMPEAEAIWLHIAHVQAEGADVKVVSDQEWDAMQNYLAEKRFKDAFAAAVAKAAAEDQPNPRAN